MKPKITAVFDTSKIAKLANVPLTDEESHKYTEQFTKILDYIEQLNSVNTEGIEPTFNVSGQENVMSEDKIGTCLPQEDVLSNATKTQDGFFVTKRVIGEENG